MKTYDWRVAVIQLYPTPLFACLNVHSLPKMRINLPLVFLNMLLGWTFPTYTWNDHNNKAQKWSLKIRFKCRSSIDVPNEWTNKCRSSIDAAPGIYLEWRAWPWLTHLQRSSVTGKKLLQFMNAFSMDRNCNVGSVPKIHLVLHDCQVNELREFLRWWNGLLVGAHCEGWQGAPSWD